MAFDKNKPKILKLDEAFNTIAGLSQDLRDQAYKLDIVRSKQNLNKAFSPLALGLGTLSTGSYIVLSRMNLNPGLVHLISSIILFGIGLKLKLITSPFGNLIEKPLKFALVDLNDNNKILTKVDLLNIGVDLPDPIKFYDLGKSDLEFKISSPKRPETKAGTSDFIEKKTENAGKADEKNIYTWNNKKSSEYALIFDQESQQTINEIIRIYEKPNVKEHFQRYALLYVSGGIAGGAAMVEKPIAKALQPAKQPAQSRGIIPSDLSDITPMPKKKTPSRQQLIERLKK
jgi:hypothetical protein